MKTLRYLTCMLLPVLCFTSGCGGGNSKMVANLSGKVTYNGQPVTGGSLSFYSDSDGLVECVISPTGEYTIENLPTGTMKVTIETESLNPKNKQQDYTPQSARGGGGGRSPRPGGGAPAGGKAKMEMGPTPEGVNSKQQGTYLKIPAKYADRAKSILTVELSKGTNYKDFELTD